MIALTMRRQWKALRSTHWLSMAIGGHVPPLLQAPVAWSPPPALLRLDEVRAGLEWIQQAAARLFVAGLTLEPLKSVNGIGSRITSSREQNIVNVVSFVIPHACQRPLVLIQPLPALGVVLSGLQ